MQWVRGAGKVGLWVGSAYCLLYQFYERVGYPIQGVGPSMYPTFNVMGDVLYVSRLALRKPVQRGDLVAFWVPNKAQRMEAVKRVLAVEGDTVTYTDEEGVEQKAVIGRGRVWVEGDNPSQSTDSRHYGPLPTSLLQGKVTCQLLPVKRARFF